MPTRRLAREREDNNYDIIQHSGKSQPNLSGWHMLIWHMVSTCPIQTSEMLIRRKMHLTRHQKLPLFAIPPFPLLAHLPPPSSALSPTPAGPKFPPYTSFHPSCTCSWGIADRLVSLQLVPYLR